MNATLGGSGKVSSLVATRWYDDGAIPDAAGGGILAAATLGMRRLGDLASGMMGLAVRLGRPAAAASVTAIEVIFVARRFSLLLMRMSRRRWLL